MSLFSPTSSLRSPGTGTSTAAASGRLRLGVSRSGPAACAGWPSGTIEALKWFGFAAMAADHWAILVLADPFHPLRTIGRLALPIFLILLARNLAAGAGAGRYWLRLLPFALVAEIAWRAAEHAGAFRPPGANILFTLALAALFWASLHRAALSASPGEKVVAALPALLALVLSTHVDYGPTALVLASCLALLAQMPQPWEHPPEHIWEHDRERHPKRGPVPKWMVSSTAGSLAGQTPASTTAGWGRANPDLARWLADRILWVGLFACSAILAAALNLPFFGAAAALVTLVPLGLLAARRLPDIKLPRAPWWVFYALYPAHVATLGLLGAVLRG